MSLLTSADYPDIRALLDTSLDTLGLPDAIIAMDSYLGEGQRMVIDYDEDAESRVDATEVARVRLAACCFVAALIAPSMPAIRSRALGPGVSYSLDVDWQTMADTLLARGYGYLDLVLTPTDQTTQRPTMFALAVGTRGA